MKVVHHMRCEYYLFESIGQNSINNSEYYENPSNETHLALDE
jgi:predicted Fe-Mo cluster-binding NifX family protein